MRFRRIRRCAALVAATVVLAAGQARAQGGACAAPDTQLALNECAAERATAADRRLRALLAELRPTLDSGSAARLRAVQIRWVRYRDAHCAWDAEAVEGGSMQPMVYATCLWTLTEERIRTLQPQLCEGVGTTGTCAAAAKYGPPADARTRRRP